MRATVPGLPTPHPLHTLMPAYLQEDSFSVRLTEGLDAVLAPVFSVLDCIDAYVDPLLAPSDFLPWLADWVGAALDDNSEESQRRYAILAAATLHRARGTARGLRAHLELATGVRVEVVETGGTTWSQRPTDGEVGVTPALEVRVVTDDPERISLALLEELVQAVKPAHLPHTIEVVAS